MNTWGGMRSLAARLGTAGQTSTIISRILVAMKADYGIFLVQIRIDYQVVQMYTKARVEEYRKKHPSPQGLSVQSDSADPSAKRPPHHAIRV